MSDNLPGTSDEHVEEISAIQRAFEEGTAIILRRRADEAADRTYFRQQHNSLLSQLTWGASLLNLGTAAAVATLSRDVLKGEPSVLGLAMCAFAIGFIRSITAHASLAIDYQEIAIGAERAITRLELMLQDRTRATTDSKKAVANRALLTSDRLWHFEDPRFASLREILRMLSWAVWAWMAGIALSAISANWPYLTRLVSG
ncbi:MAG TPA: hypothetical protein VEA44_16045 [Caulobacter sp.]|nr:hypothetical protein [Caulobacter sp.]